MRIRSDMREIVEARVNNTGSGQKQGGEVKSGRRVRLCESGRRERVTVTHLLLPYIRHDAV